MVAHRPLVPETLWVATVVELALAALQRAPAPWPVRIIWLH